MTARLYGIFWKQRRNPNLKAALLSKECIFNGPPGTEACWSDKDGSPTRKLKTPCVKKNKKNTQKYSLDEHNEGALSRRESLC